jgi:ribonuclease-3
MEFLGDACLEMVIASYLVEFTEFPEGKMSQFRSNLTRKESLAAILKSWKVESYFHVGRGMKIEKLPDSVYADYLESLFGALYLDRGFEVVKRCITHIFKPIIEEQKDNPNLFSNAKSKLQELAMAQKAELPTYTIKSRSGKDHNPTYTIEVKVLNKSFCASGPSIKIAEVKAAENAFSQLKKT